MNVLFTTKIMLVLKILDFKDLTNEALSRDREACKQHAFKMFPSLTSTLQPKENRTARIWLQAPFKKGQTILKLLFYYETPAQQTPRYYKDTINS